MKKILALTAALLLLLPALAGCATAGSSSTSAASVSTAVSIPAATSGSVDIGVVLPTRDEPRWLQDQKQFEDIIASTNYSIEVLFSQGSSATERTNVEILISKGIQVLIICPQDAAAATSAVEAARAEGVTVITYDRLITNTEAVDYYVTFDSVAVGEAQGQYLADQANGDGLSLYLYAGSTTDNNAFLFFEGAWKVLQPRIADGTFVIRNSSEAVKLQDKATLTRDEMSVIIDQIRTDWDLNLAKSKAETDLAAADGASKGDCYILAPNDGTARAIADVFAADKGVSTYWVTGQDAEQPSVQYIIDGKQSMTVFKDTRVLAKDAMEIAIEVMNGGTPATDTTYNNQTKDVPAKQTEIVVVTKDNVWSALIDSGYYSAGDFTGL